MKDAQDAVDAIIDAVRFIGMAARTMILCTGTPMDFMRDLLVALIEGSERTSSCRGLARVRGAYDKVGEWINGMRGGRSAGLSLQPRKDVPIAFHMVAWIHYTIVAFCIAYPILFSRESGWDFVYLAFILMIVMHWFVFWGECIFLYFEKKLFYEKYEMGSMPKLYWYGDVFPWQLCLAIMMTSILGINSSILMVVLRNITLKFSITLSLAL